jgi:hypothetical protein
MVDRGIVKEWVSKADEDFCFARVNLEEKKRFFFPNLLSFSSGGGEIIKGLYRRRSGAGISQAS